MAVDVLRGVAVLGILAMNIYAFALPFPAYTDPTKAGGTDPLSIGTWFFTHIFFDQKFMPIFSALFGAGLVLMWERAEARGAKIGRIWIRREFWLLVIGLIHAYLIWMGDILVSYALFGFLIFAFRKWSPRRLFVVGAVLLALGVPSTMGMAGMQSWLTAQGQAAEAKLEAGETLTEEETKIMEAWQENRRFSDPGPEMVQESIETHRGGWAGIAAFRAPIVIGMQTWGIAIFGLWRILSMMLWGMAAMKLGIFAAQRSPSFYRRMITFGYGIGLPLVVMSCWRLAAVDWDPPTVQAFDFMWNWFGSVAMAIGHVGVVMWICRAEHFARWRGWMASTGRMAFTNYLMQSVLCTTLFYGYGFGLFGHVERPWLMAIVAVVWVVQVVASVWWLGRFRFGPAEWLWRTLTYGRAPAMRREPAAVPATA
ncbi:MAG: DUF418 domain-containing protein [Acidobacteriota bacterium]